MRISDWSSDVCSSDLHEQVNHRSRAAAPHVPERPRAWAATAPGQVWSWDITFLPAAVRGEFYRLYLVMDVFSRLIVGWEIHHSESSAHAATLISKACLRHRVRRDQLVLHSDNGSPMKEIGRASCRKRVCQYV